MSTVRSENRKTDENRYEWRSMLMPVWISLVLIVLLPLSSCSQPEETPNAPTAAKAVADTTDGWGETVDNPGQIASLPESVGANDWSGFRGDSRDNHVSSTSFATDWTANPPRELWRRRVGEAWSSFAVVGDYAFTQEQRGPNEVVVCYHAETGDEIWINQLAERFTETGRAGPRATPTFLDGKLYTQSGMGTLQCLNASTGEVSWARSVPTDSGAEVPQYGYASSPLVVDGLVIVFASGPDGKGVAAYNAEDGEVAWTSGAGTHGYTSGHLANLAGTDQVIFSSDIGVESFNPSDGIVLWKNEWATKINPRCVQPILLGNDSLVIGSAGGVGTRRLSISKSGDDWSVTEDWQTTDFEPFTGDSVYHDGFIYGFNNRNLMCVDADSAEIRWKSKPYAGQVLLIPEMKMLLVLAENGMVKLIEANPEAEVEIAKLKAIAGKTFNHPVIANGRLFVRNGEEAACFALAD